MAVSSTTPTPTATPTPTPTPVATIDVKVLDRLVKTNPPYYGKFFSSKENEIKYLSDRGWANSGTAFKAPLNTTPGIVMAKRMILSDSANQAQILTWAAAQDDINSLKSAGFTESSDGDFYVFPTSKTNTVGVTRMKFMSSAYNKTFYTFAINQSAIDTLTAQGWTVDKINVFYVYPF